MRIQLLSVFLLACAEAESAGPTVDSEVDSSRPDAVTPWILPEDTAEPPDALSPDARSEALATAVDLALELEPEAVLALHDLLLPPPPLGSGDLTGCPVTLTYDYGEATAFFWQGECTGPDGTMYSGTGTLARYDDFANEGGVFDGFELSLAGRIEAPDGTWLEGSGRVGGYDGAGGELTAWARVFEGTFRAGGPRAPDDPWLDGSRRPSLEVSGWTYVPTAGRSVTVVGALAGDGLFEGGVTGVAFDGLTLRETSAGNTCEREAGGAASVRGDDGAWYDVLFDGPADAGAEGGQVEQSLCDGCGETFYRGQAVDPTCFDARPLLRGLP